MSGKAREKRSIVQNIISFGQKSTSEPPSSVLRLIEVLSEEVEGLSVDIKEGRGKIRY